MNVRRKSIILCALKVPKHYSLKPSPTHLIIIHQNPSIVPLNKHVFESCEHDPFQPIQKMNTFLYIDASTPKRLNIVWDPHVERARERERRTYLVVR